MICLSHDSEHGPLSHALTCILHAWSQRQTTHSSCRSAWGACRHWGQFFEATLLRSAVLYPYLQCFLVSRALTLNDKAEREEMSGVADARWTIQRCVNHSSKPLSACSWLSSVLVCFRSAILEQYLLPARGSSAVLA